MVFLDTNFLIAMANRDAAAMANLREWFQQGQGVATSSAAWAEFCTGPVESADLNDMEAMLEDRIMPFGPSEAECAARIYRETGCRRGHRVDSFIAATAIVAGGLLATKNRKDFERFMRFGLRLA